MMSVVRRRLAAILLGLSVGAAPVIAAGLPAPWVELAADGALSIRAVVAPGAPCPPVSADGAALVAVKRSAPDNNFPIEVCEARAPARSEERRVGKEGRSRWGADHLNK